jgi:rhodanese-related sulfurtransferase
MPVKKAADIVAEAKGQIDNLTPEQVADEVKNGAVLVDIRDGGEREQSGYIPGAVHASRGLLEFHADPSSPYHKPEMDPGKRVILHCASGGRSALAALTLREMGYTDVAHLDSGYNGWKEAGHPTEGGSNS